MEKLQDIKKCLRTDFLASELKFSIFVAALKNYKHDFLIRPFPPDFIENGTKNFEKLNDVVNKTPSFEDLLNCDNANQVDSDVLSLLHFVLNSREYQLKTVPKPQFPEILGKSPCILKIIDPKYILEVCYDESSNAEKRFQQSAENCPRNYAYHGTKLFLVHSILNFGLQQHLNKTGLFGDGIYLSHELSVSLPFSPAGLGWTKAKLGDFLSCVALCEYVDDPFHCKMKKSANTKNPDIPDKYLLISNNDCVRIRHLLIYSHRKQIQKNAENQLISWCKKNFLVLSLVFYAIILVLIGLSKSRTGEYYKEIVFTKIYKAFESLQNVFIRK